MIIQASHNEQNSCKSSLFTHPPAPQSSAAGEAWMAQGAGVCSALLKPTVERSVFPTGVSYWLNWEESRNRQPAELYPALEMCPPHL